ncbi:uncharacterized protein N0V89_008789 [Didymosphaeria variabile]|uniref:CRAL-TRIO domain-containing protein n=1 Tax=Didymosphaeria variabile TaxID=1932322 RepID=A0A9W9C952_9PLEO|nr:uncharacterized protein N0V89_008789 [Didymosphaeria variabile]KAJ4350168.1 hypothetical protein N0V89_008789 [Didymosphaeria variabile]
MEEVQGSELKAEGEILPGSAEVMASLTTDEAAAFKKFVERCESVHMHLLSWPADLDKNETRSGINDASTLLRFLRARQFDVEGAYTQFKEAINLRISTNIIKGYDEIDIHNFDEARKLYPHWTGRFSKRRLPICFFDIAHLNGETLAKYNAPNQGREEGVGTKHTLAVHDFLTRFVLPLADEVKGDTKDGPVINCLYLIDASSLGIKQAWGVKKYAQETSGILAGSYPEVLSRVFVINAPAFFPAAWKWIKPWIEAGTAEKLVFLSADEVMPTLKEHIDIDSIPKRWGGELEWSHGMLPDLRKEVKEKLGWSEAQEFPVGPVKWRNEGDGLVACLSGGDNGTLRSGKVADGKGRISKATVMNGEKTDGPTP